MAVIARAIRTMVDLNDPITVTRPLGKTARVSSIRFFADDQRSALRSLADPVCR